MTCSNTAGYSQLSGSLPEDLIGNMHTGADAYSPLNQCGGGRRRKRRSGRKKKGQTQKASRGRQTVIAKNMCSCMDMLGSSEDVECTLICKSGSKTKTRKLRFKGSRGSSVVRSLLKGPKKTKKKKKKKRKKSKKAKMLRKYLGPADAMALDAVSAIGSEAVRQGQNKLKSYIPEMPKMPEMPKLPKLGLPGDFEPHKLGSAELDVPDGDRDLPVHEPSPAPEPSPEDASIDKESYEMVKPPSGEEPSMM